MEFAIYGLWVSSIGIAIGLVGLTLTNEPLRQGVMTFFRLG